MCCAAYFAGSILEPVKDITLCLNTFQAGKFFKIIILVTINIKVYPDEYDLLVEQGASYFYQKILITQRLLSLVLDDFFKHCGWQAAIINMVS